MRVENGKSRESPRLDFPSCVGSEKLSQPHALNRVIGWSATRSLSTSKGFLRCEMDGFSGDRKKNKHMHDEKMGRKRDKGCRLSIFQLCIGIDMFGT